MIFFLDLNLKRVYDVNIIRIDENSPKGCFKNQKINFLVNKMNVIKSSNQYITEVKTEAKKISWPTKKVTVRDSVIVVAISLATAAFLGGVDYLLSYLIKEFIV